MTRRRCVAVLALVATMVLVACGDTDGSPEPAEEGAAASPVADDGLGPAPENESGTPSCPSAEELPSYWSGKEMFPAASSGIATSVFRCEDEREAASVDFLLAPSDSDADHYVDVFRHSYGKFATSDPDNDSFVEDDGGLAYVDNFNDYNFVLRALARDGRKMCEVYRMAPREGAELTVSFRQEAAEAAIDFASDLCQRWS